MTSAFNLSQFANKVNTSGQADLATAVTGTLPVANGGTGQSTTSGAINALLPTQSGNTGKYLTTNGTSASWGSVASFGGGTNVTSATDVTLTSTSTQVQNINITTSGKFVILPNATTCSKGGIIFNIQNAGGFPFGIKDASGNLLVTSLNWNNSQSLYLIDNSTSAGNWGIVTAYYGDNLSTVTADTSLDDFAILSSSACVYLYEPNSTTLSLMVGSISGTTITYGTPSTVATTSGFFAGQRSVIRTSANSGLLGYGKYQAGTYYMYVRAFTISGTTITFGSETSLAGATSDGVEVSSLCPLADNLAVILYPYWGGTYSHYARVISTSGTSITLGSATNYYNDPDNYWANNNLIKIDSSRFMVKSARTTNKFKIGSVSGTTITFGTEYTASYSANINGGFIPYSSTLTYANGNKIVSSGTTISSMTPLGVSMLDSGYGGNGQKIELSATNSIYLGLAPNISAQYANADVVSASAQQKTGYTSKLIKLNTNEYLVTGRSTFNYIGTAFVKVLA